MELRVPTEAPWPRKVLVDDSVGIDNNGQVGASPPVPSRLGKAQ